MLSHQNLGAECGFQHEKDAQRIVTLQDELFYLGKEISEKTL